MQLIKHSKVLVTLLVSMGFCSSIMAAQYSNTNNRQHAHQNQHQYQSRYDQFGRERKNFDRRYQRKQQQPRQQQRYYNGHQRQNQAQQYQQRQRQYQQQYQRQYYDGHQNRYESRYGQQRPQYRQINRPQQTVQRERYADKLCETGDYNCMTVKRKQTWDTLFPDEKQRDLVKRLNRLNIKLRVGMQIAVPKDIETATKLDIAPFKSRIDTNGKKLILVSLPKLAWGAFDASGKLVNWGPVSGGKDYCSDIGKSCNTIRGVFAVFEKKGQYCKSESYPVDRGGGAPMPYCMFFHDGFALHGSKELPGYNASHGCVRMYKEDAKWLNEEFVDIPFYKQDKGTEIIIQTAAASDDIQESYFEEETLEDVNVQSESYDNFDRDEFDQIRF